MDSWANVVNFLAFSCVVVSGYYFYRIYKLTSSNSVLWMIVALSYAALLRVYVLVANSPVTTWMCLFWAILAWGVFKLHSSIQVFVKTGNGSTKEKIENKKG